MLWSPSRSPGESKAVLGDADSSLLDISALKTPGQNEGVVVLGAPIGSPTFVEAFVSATPTKLVGALQRVLLMKSAQCRVSLLRYCAVPLNGKGTTAPFFGLGRIIIDSHTPPLRSL